MNNQKESVIKTIKLVRNVVVFLFIGLLIFTSVDFIPSRHVGIVFNRVTGKIDKEPATGMRLHLPFVEKVYNISTYTHTLTLGPGQGDDGQPFDSTIIAQTRDGQWLRTVLDVQYRVLPENAFEVYERYQSNDRSVGNNLILKMPPVIQRAVESITTKYDVVEALGENRDQMRQEIEAEVSKEMAKYGVTLESFSIIDTDAGDEIEAAIAREAVEQQNIQTAKQAQEKARIENKTMLEKERSEAEKKQIAAEAEFKANETISKSLTPELIKNKEAEARIIHGWIEVKGVDSVIVDSKD